MAEIWREERMLIDGELVAARAGDGSYKQSGIGREMGVAGFAEYLEIKSIAQRAS